MRMQGKDFIQSIVEKLSVKGDLSSVRLPKHQAPTKRVVLDYINDSMNWLVHAKKVIGTRKAKELYKLEDSFYRIAFPNVRTSGVHTKGSTLPQPKHLKKIRSMSDPYHIPDIGGKDGILTHLIRSIPVGAGTCYKNAIMIASAIPGVKVVFGLYPRYGGGVRKTSKGFSAREQIAIERMKSEYEYFLDCSILYSKNLGNNWYYGPFGPGSNPTLEYVDKDTLQCLTPHAWCSYKGYHFDPFLYNINKRYTTNARFYSAKKKKFITWIEYFMWKETDMFELTGSQLKTGTGKNYISENVRKDLFLKSMTDSQVQCFELIVDHIHQVKHNNHERGDWAFPVKIPSKRKWIKDKQLYPPGLFSE